MKRKEREDEPLTGSAEFSRQLCWADRVGRLVTVCGGRGSREVKFHIPVWNLPLPFLKIPTSHLLLDLSRLVSHDSKNQMLFASVTRLVAWDNTKTQAPSSIYEMLILWERPAVLRERRHLNIAQALT